MASIDSSTIAAITKIRYPEGKPPRELKLNNPAFAAIAKNERFGGKFHEVPMTIAATQAASATFSNAYANAALATSYQNMYRSFQLTRKFDYSLARITGEAMKAYQGDLDSMVNVWLDSMDLAMFTAMRQQATMMFRDGLGWRGKIASTSGNVITLANKFDAYNFELGMILESFFNAGGGTNWLFSGIRGSTPSVTAIDRTAGTITVSAIGALAANDYLCRAGDRTVSLTGDDMLSTSNVVTGMKQWLAGSDLGTTPTGTKTPFPTTIYNVDRSADKVSLAGNILDATGAAPDEALIQLASNIAAEGGKPNFAWLNPRDYATLVKYLGSRLQYVEAKSQEDPSIGFQAVRLHGDAGPIDVVADINVPQSEAYVLDFAQWEFASINGAPHIQNYDSNEFLRVSNDDAFEVRVVTYGNLKCKSPGKNGRLYNYNGATPSY
jgi:hypothetical protein